MKRRFLALAMAIFLGAFILCEPTLAQTKTPGRISMTSTPTPEATASSTTIEREPTSVPPQPNITKETQETVEPMIKLLRDQELGPVFPWNPVKYAIRGACRRGPQTQLFFFFPGEMLIAATRHLVGFRIRNFLPAALSVVCGDRADCWGRTFLNNCFYINSY
jgi:hypothetical protein